MKRKSIATAFAAAIAATLVVTAAHSPAEARPYKSGISAKYSKAKSGSRYIGKRKVHRSRYHHRRAQHGQYAAQHTVDLTHDASSGSSDLISQARRYLGATARQIGLPSTLWCADFMNHVLRKTGREGTGSRAARSFASYGKRISGPKVGAIAVLSRGAGGGHVGIVSGVDASGNPILISGNHNRRVAEAVYSRSRILAYVMP
jgi:uncharacterized protein (TIGR02594 family)